MTYELKEKRTVLETVPFAVEELHLSLSGRDLSHPYYRLRCPDWVNVLPLTSDGRAILIRQPRAGVLKEVLELPGGVIDPGEKDPTLAAARELEEETGYRAGRLLSLGSINPNPAIQTNRCHFFVALGCYLNHDRQHFPDAEESIRVELCPASELTQLVRTGRIDHALCCLNVMLASRYLPPQEAGLG